MNDDAELLRQYIEERSQAAFAELVHRRIGLVYQTALRRVGGDAHLAEDVAQRVFTALAAKASGLRRHPTLTGWLFVSAQHAAAQVVRAEQRRKKWEAHAMRENPESEVAASTELEPVMADALLELRADDRDALILRFFEQRSFAEIGSVLRTTEDAGRKRVERALEKLRALFARRGITSSAAALSAALVGFGSGLAPTRVAAGVAQHALANAGAAAGVTSAVALAFKVVPFAAALVGGSWLVMSQYDSTQRLQAELDATGAQTPTISAVRAENERLAARGREIDDLRRAIGVTEIHTKNAGVPTAETGRRPFVLARVEVTPEGTIAWNGKGVTLDDFVSTLSAAAQDPRAANDRFVVRGVGASFSSLSYVIDEARKAGVPHLVIESDAKPDSKSEIPNWF